MGNPSDRRSQAERANLIAYFESKDAPKVPRPEAGGGSISVNFDAGYIVLTPASRPLKDAMRVVWTKEDTRKKKPFPAGEYDLRRYVVSRTDDKGVEWNIWATGGSVIRAVTVRDGEETRLDLDFEPSLKFNPKVNKKGQLALGGAFTGDGKGTGVSIVKDEARIVVTFVVLEGEREAARGTAAYG